MITIEYIGDTWRLAGEGAMRDGKVYCHLISTTRGRQQRNGWVPLQIGDWIDQQVILSAAIQQEEKDRADYQRGYKDAPYTAPGAGASAAQWRGYHAAARDGRAG